MASPRHRELDYSFPEIVLNEYNVINNVTGNKSEELYAKCPLCYEQATNFYCSDCVQSGNFTRSKKKLKKNASELSYTLKRFADKKPDKFNIEIEKEALVKRFEDAFAKKKEIENLKLSIQITKDNIVSLKRNIKDVKRNIDRGEKRMEDIRNIKIKSLQEQEVLAVKQRKRRDTVKLKHAQLSISEADLNTKQCALKSVVNQRVQELVTHIFPITKVPPYSSREDGLFSEYSLFSELEEARKTVYIEGQWVIAGSPMDKTLYRIVEPCLPITGDYSAYPTYYSSLANSASCRNQIENIFEDNVSDADRHQFDVAFGISSALSYTAQLINILAFYMDVHLPKRSSINDFYKDECIERFYSNVAKLNANVINLCLSQNVNIYELSSYPHRTISNLLLLLDSKHIGSRRYLSFEDQEEQLESMEDSIFKDVPVINESDSEGEFVHIDEDDLLEVPVIDPVPSSQQINKDLLTSVTHYLSNFWAGNK